MLLATFRIEPNLFFSSLCLQRLLEELGVALYHGRLAHGHGLMAGHGRDARATFSSSTLYHPPMPKPCRSDLHFNSLDELLTEIDRLHSTGWEQSGRWSLAMVSDHLTRWMTCMLDGGTIRVPGPFRWLARAMIRRMGRKQKYPSIKIFAPAAMKPAADVSEPTAVAELRAAVKRLQQLPGSTVDTHPFGPLSAHDFLQMTLLHAAHHLAFLKPKGA